MQSANASELTTDIAVIGGGAAGIGVIASLLKRSPGLRISLIEPADTHYYQPGWTLVGGGAYAQGDTARPMAGLVPPGVEWLRTRVERVDPEARRLLLESGGSLEYRNLIVCPGLRLAWERIEGLEETLGRNGVTSNYRYDLAPYTWELVRGLRGGKALFTQPAMPIKCAGAPQKAMYLSCDHWLREGVLQDIEVEFDLAGAALFGVADFVPPLMEYVRKYSAELAFNSNLVKVDGAARKAWFEVREADVNSNLAGGDF
ncbi:NAD(P)/FAD-dependent oxidoreductase, partial [Pseudomonas aeruginosa]|uniref:NAD(P)/FAD-dependent oxidoreductase n=1 Tax=Pseudomonas aeruginosa TaxID=287 RepID=UPI00117A8631